MNYRIYLLRAGHIRAAESFAAIDDAEAKETATQVYRACSDVFEGCELWYRAELIAKLTPPTDSGQDGFVAIGREEAMRMRAEVVLARQQNILELEDHLQRTFLRFEPAGGSSRRPLNCAKTYE